MPEHIPVLRDETVDLLRPERGGVFVDATLGLGGHTRALLTAAEQAGKKLRIIGIDQDTEALALAKEALGESIEYAWGNFADIDELLEKRELKKVDGILMDIGVSSMQLDSPERGFSFQQNGPLDMRMNPQEGETAADIINRWQERQLADLFYKYGEERLSRKIARMIVEERPFSETAELADLIVRAYPAAARYKRPHPATRVFQSLRIEVNRELDVLKDGIERSLPLLSQGGILAVITFHSLEDRIVKWAFREAAASGDYEILTKKPIEASREEAMTNPRSRSAKLRGIRRI